MNFTSLSRTDVELARRLLIKNDYQPVPVVGPVQGGKRPVGANWQHTVGMTDWRPDAPNTGILARGHRVIDNDVDDPIKAAAIDAMIAEDLGPAPIRQRANSPRTLRLYRAAVGAPGKRIVPLGGHQKVEVLGNGQQFVVHGVHPSGARLEWRDASPFDTPRDELTAVTEEQIAALLVKIYDQFATPEEKAKHAPGGTRDRSRSINGCCNTSSDTNMAAEAEAALADLPNDYDDYNDWLRIGMSAFQAGAPFEAWDRWCQRHSSYAAKRTRDAWTSFQQGGVRLVTPRTLFREVQNRIPEWIPPDRRSPLADAGLTPDPARLAEAKQVDEPRTMAQPPLLTWHGDTDTNREPQWLVEETVPQTGKGLLSGQWGTGKTFVALDLGACVMTKENFAGRRIARQGGVLFIAPEGASEIPIRLEGIVTEKLWNFQPGPDAMPVDVTRLPIAWIDECPPLVNKESVATLVATARSAAEIMRQRFGLPLALIVIDTVAAASGVVDENAAAEGHRVMNALESLSRQTGAFVLGVDHFGKSVETGTRGSSAKEAAADVVLACLGDRDVSGPVSNTRLAVRKLRGGAAGAETSFTLEVVRVRENLRSDPITTCVVCWSTGPSSSAPTRRQWPMSVQVFRRAMQVALTEDGRRIRPFGAEGPEVLAVTEAKVRAEFFKSYPVDGETLQAQVDAKRKAFGRALQKALGLELVVSRDIGGTNHLWFVSE